MKACGHNHSDRPEHTHYLLYPPIEADFSGAEQSILLTKS